MPRRETIQQNDKVLLSLGTVNQRLNDVELPDADYSNIEGTFPEFSGLQSRIWGKRTLAKFASQVRGIYQFWTPLGYAGGVYQFSSELDFGKWLTPISKFPSLTLPPSKPFDASGYTLDDFGWSNGLNFGIGDTGATGANLPNDYNGGPAGQGTRCQWQTVTTNYTSATYIKTGTTVLGTNNFSNVLYVDQINNVAGPGCPVYSSLHPSPVVPQPIVRPTTFASTALDGTLLCSVEKRGYYTLSAPTGSCNFTATTLDEQIPVSEKKASYDFTPLQAFYKDLDDVKVYVNLRQGNNPFPVTNIDTSVLLNVDFSDGGNFANVPFAPMDYLDFSTPTQISYAGNGTRKVATMQVLGLTITYTGRVCL